MRSQEKSPKKRQDREWGALIPVKQKCMEPEQKKKRRTMETAIKLQSDHKIPEEIAYQASALPLQTKVMQKA
jgi:hypothetical protein